MAGGTALVLGIDHPERVHTLTFVTATSGDDDLPSMTDEFLQAVPSTPDFTSREAVIEHIVEVMRAYAGRSPLFDEAAMRALATADVDRTGNMASTLTNHFEIDFDGPRNGGFDQVGVPALVIHGMLDPVHPRAHGQALAQHLGAELLELPDTGHDVPPEHWQLVCSRLAQHTGTSTTP